MMFIVVFLFKINDKLGRSCGQQVPARSSTQDAKFSGQILAQDLFGVSFCAMMNVFF
jgi:hypothetical protein